MRTTLSPVIVTAFLSGFVLHEVGCEGTVTIETSVTSTSAGAGGQSGTGGQPGTGGQGGSAGGDPCDVEEICDHFDNNCDGQVDEGCSCVEGEVEPCYSGPPGTAGVGTCLPGEHTCDATNMWGECIGQVTPELETCNALDDNCDGQADNLPDISCGVGGCLVTVAACNAGQPNTCVPGQPEQEVCDGVDNNCDSFTDETFPGQGSACDTGKPGPCAPGTSQCVMGSMLCTSVVPPQLEICDGIDNDCSGVIDDVSGLGNPCSTGVPGACADGIIVCTGNGLDCESITGPSPEVCDGIDDDCDGQIDQGNPDGGAACTTGLGGACEMGTMTCTAGMLQCVANQAQPFEICNGLDDTCDGQIDENNPTGGLFCDTGLPNQCAAGTTLCKNGMLVCIPNNKSSAEICGNGTDDNCDGTGDPSVAVYFLDSFPNAASGWTLGPEWQIGPAKASTGQTSGQPDPGTDNTPSGDGVAGVVIGGNATSSIHPPYYLTSPAINTAGKPSVYLEFYRWLNSDPMPYMNNTIEVFDGAAWQQVWASGSSAISDSSWTRITHNVSAYANAGMRVRFGFSIGQTTGVSTVSSWNIDDVQILSSPCQ